MKLYRGANFVFLLINSNKMPRRSGILNKIKKSFHVCGYYEPSQGKAICCMCVYQKYKRRNHVYVCACAYVASILLWLISYLDQYLSIIPLQLHTVVALAIHKQTHTVSLTSGGNNAINFFPSSQDSLKPVLSM